MRRRNTSGNRVNISQDESDEDDKGKLETIPEFVPKKKDKSKVKPLPKKSIIPPIKLGPILTQNVKNFNLTDRSY